MSQISTQAGRRALRQTHPKGENLSKGSSAESKNLLAGCIAAVNEILYDTPSVDFSQDRTTQSGMFAEDALKAGRELELKNMLKIYAFESVEGLPPGKYAYDMVWVDEWRGDSVRSRLCDRQFRAEGLQDDLFAGTPNAFFIQKTLGQGCELQRPRNPCH